MPDLVGRIRELDDVTAVQLLRHVGSLIFADPTLVYLLATSRAARLPDLSDEEKRELLSPTDSIRFARDILETLARDARFEELLAKVFATLRRDALVAEARIPRGLAHALTAIAGFAEGTRSASPSIPGGATPERAASAYDPRIDSLAYSKIETGAWTPPPAGRVAESSSPQPDPTVTGAGPAMTAEPASERTRTAWPHLQCDAVVVVGTPFDLEIGLRAERDEQVGGTRAMTVPATDCTLDLEVMFDPAAFALVEGDRQFALFITAANLYPRRTLKMVALGGSAIPEHRVIGVAYTLQGSLRGYATRHLRAVSDFPEPDGAAVAPEPVAFAEMDLSPSEAREAPDLTIVIKRGDGGGGGRLVFTARSPHFPVEVTSEPLTEDLGSEPDQFLAHVIRTASGGTTPRRLFTGLEGLGRMSIASKLPRPITDALRRVAARVAPQAASVLIVSDDPYIPWELAVLDPPLGARERTPDASPFLGAQVALGRWILPRGERPRPHPARHLVVREQVVVAGVYERVPRWSRLERAEQEAKDLLEAWAGTSHKVEATFDDVLDCLRGDPAADVLHFALHGKFDPRGLEEGLVLIERPADESGPATPAFLRPEDIASCDLSRCPFVFLNACQVGAARKVLGDHAGMAAAFLFAGASAVVAPLWSIDDADARGLALSFYEAAWTGEPPAELLRRQRARFTEKAARSRTPEAGTATHLAYQFFGHPRYVLERQAAGQETES